MTSFYAASPNGMLVTPLLEKLPGVRFPPHRPLGSRIALTAWTATVTSAGGVRRERGIVSICPRFDAKAFRAFRGAFRGKGPERLPVSLLTPGS